jgi:hypothetical protein
MPRGKRFPYQILDPSQGNAGALPYVPLNLAHQSKSEAVSGLIDSGSMLNVLPYDVGVRLGADWSRQTVRVQLSGNLADLDARAILLTAAVEGFAPVQLAFAWTRSSDVPLILGQVNFFMEFDVYLFRTDMSFEIKLRRQARHSQR